MRILFMGNNWVAWRIARWLQLRQNTKIVGLVGHSPETRQYYHEMVDAARVEPDRIFDGSKLREPETMGAIA